MVPGSHRGSHILGVMVRLRAYQILKNKENNSDYITDKLMIIITTKQHGEPVVL